MVVCRASTQKYTFCCGGRVRLTIAKQKYIIKVDKKQEIMDTGFYWIFLDLALILFATKSFSLLMRKLGIPEVVGALFAGILLGPSMFGIVHGSETLKTFAEVGVIMIMFTAGMETNLKQLRATGLASVVITVLGVVLPMGLGVLIATLFNGGFQPTREQLLTNLYYGTVLTATSVSITVATLKELGKLNSRTGTAIISAAILDDIIGLCILSFIISMKDTTVNPVRVLSNTFLFFLFAIGIGLVMNFLFRRMEKLYPHNRRMPIFSLVICFLLAFSAEEVFGVADITGAFIAGVVLSGLKSSKYIEHRVDIGAYLIFAPIFFASIGINNKFQNFDMTTFLFGLMLIVAGMIGKVAGCGLGARICKFGWRDSLFIGIGMMPRAEVLLITVQKGVSGGFINDSFMPYALGLVIVSSLLTPIFLKILNKNDSAPAYSQITTACMPDNEPMGMPELKEDAKDD